jgi:hypothetical protein
MKRILLALAIALLPSLAFAQCNGVFAAHTVCGNNTASPGIPGQVPQASIIGPGGSSGSIQYNNGGFFGGVSGTANQIPVFPGGTAAPVATTATTWFDNAFCNTIGYIIARTTGGWVCARGIPVNIIWLGAIADGSTAYSSTNATTNATALTTALATGSCAFIPYNVNGYSFIGNTIALATSQCILGENQVLLKSQPATNGYFIHVTAFEVLAAPAIIQNVAIDMTGAGTTSTAIRFATASGTVAGVQISQLLCTNTVECIGDEVPAVNGVVDLKLYDIRMLKTLGRQIYIRRSRGFIWLDTIRIDQTAGAGQAATPTWASAQFDDIIGLEINRFDSVGPVTTTYQSGATGLVINGAGGGAASVWLNRILVDSSSGNGITISAISLLNANWIESYANLGNALILSNVATSQLSNVFIVGGVGLTGAASANGFSCTNCTNIAVSNLLTQSNTGAGVIVSGTSDGLTINGLFAISNTSFAINLLNAVDNIVITNGKMSGNGGTFSNSTGTHNVIENIVGYNPVGVTAAATMGASPTTITAGPTPETHYVRQSATNTATCTQNGQQVAALSNAATFYTIDLGPNESYACTWATTAPTYTKFVH